MKYSLHSERKLPKSYPHEAPLTQAFLIDVPLVLTDFHFDWPLSIPLASVLVEDRINEQLSIQIILAAFNVYKDVQRSDIPLFAK